MSDELVDKAESMLDNHETEVADNEAPNPENALSDEAVVEELKRVMDLPGMSYLCGMVVINWRIYAIIRQEMESAAKGKMSPEVFSALLQGLNGTAMQPFSVVDLKKDVKKKLLPWVRDISDERVNKNRRRKHGDAESTTEDDT